MGHSDCGWTCGFAGKTVRSLENTCHTWALLQWWLTVKRRYVKCMHLYLLVCILACAAQTSRQRVCVLAFVHVRVLPVSAGQWWNFMEVCYWKSNLLVPRSIPRWIHCRQRQHIYLCLQSFRSQGNHQSYSHIHIHRHVRLLTRNVRMHSHTTCDTQRWKRCEMR